MLLTVEKNIEASSLLLIHSEGVGKLAEDGVALEEAAHQVQYLN